MRGREAAPPLERGSLAGVRCVEREKYTLSPAERLSYAERLGLDLDALVREHGGATAAALRALQRAHLDRVTYETTGMHAGEGPPALDPHESARRIARGRGGYCFILVDAYAALLTTLGFRVSLHVAAVAPEPVSPDKWGNHVLLLVHAPGGDEGAAPLVSDVGLGDGPRAPFALRAHSWTEEDGPEAGAARGAGRRASYSYALARRRGAGGAEEWRFTHDAAGSFAGFSFRLDSSCAGAHEFARYHEYLWTSAGSPFRRAGVVAQRVAADGTKLSLRNEAIRRVRPYPGRASTCSSAASWPEWRARAEEVFHLRAGALTAEEQRTLWRLIRSKRRGGPAPAILRRWLGRGVLSALAAWWIARDSEIAARTRRILCRGVHAPASHEAVGRRE